MINRIAVDTNILLYLHEESFPQKTEHSKSIILNRPFISSQVISEYLNALKRLTRAPKFELLDHGILLTKACEIAHVDHKILIKSRELILRYDFQLFDSIIIASALHANCDILYSEDFQHNQMIEKRLTIINPFL